MGQAADGHGLFEEAADEFIGGDSVPAQDLEGDDTVDLRVVGFVDHTHSAAPQFGDNPVAPVLLGFGGSYNFV